MIMIYCQEQQKEKVLFFSGTHTLIVLAALMLGMMNGNVHQRCCCIATALCRQTAYLIVMQGLSLVTAGQGC